MNKQTFIKLLESDDMNLLGVWVKFFKTKSGKFRPISSQKLPFIIHAGDEFQLLMNKMVEPKGYTRKYLFSLSDNFVNGVN